jgi:hypothetical protein
VISELREAEIERAPVVKSATRTTLESSKQGVNLKDLQKLIAHGVLLPKYFPNDFRALETIVGQFPEIDILNITTNMKKYNVTAKQIQRLLANNPKYHPRDVLHALSQVGANILYSLVPTFNSGIPRISYWTTLS